MTVHPAFPEELTDSESTRKAISARFETRFQIDDVRPIVVPLLDGLQQTNDKLQAAIERTDVLVQALGNVQGLSDEQKKALVQSVVNASEAAKAIQRVLEDRESLLV
jgi:hypothetical protein